MRAAYPYSQRDNGHNPIATCPDSASRDKVFRVALLLSEGFREGCNAGQDAAHHEHHRDDRPNDAPALRGSSIPLCELAGIGAVDLSENEIVADVPDAVQRGHDADE